jgi:hypothetical protein
MREMRGALTLAGIVLCLFAFTGGSAALSYSSLSPISYDQRGDGPTLWLTTWLPLTLTGSGFRPHERVRVVVAFASTKLRRRVVAGDAGSFVVRFRHATVGRCDGIAARATGNRGSRAVLRAMYPACIES